MFFSDPSVVLISGPQKMHCQPVKEKINEQNTGIIEKKQHRHSAKNDVL